MKLQSNKVWTHLLLLIGVAYPFFVYFGYKILPTWSFVLMGAGLIALRLFSYRRKVSAFVLWPVFAVVALVLGCLFIRNELGAVQAYPILVSVSVAVYFAYSLYKPPTIIERIARKFDPDLTPEGVVYTRRVTWVWVAFLVCNAALSLASALWGTMAQWVLWNGFVSYLLMGILFVGEYFVRRFVKS